jgi:hypothetical protein
MEDVAPRFEYSVGVHTGATPNSMGAEHSSLGGVWVKMSAARQNSKSRNKGFFIKNKTNGFLDTSKVQNGALNEKKPGGFLSYRRQWSYRRRKSPAWGTTERNDNYLL